MGTQPCRSQYIFHWLDLAAYSHIFPSGCSPNFAGFPRNAITVPKSGLEFYMHVVQSLFGNAYTLYTAVVVNLWILKPYNPDVCAIRCLWQLFLEGLPLWRGFLTLIAWSWLLPYTVGIAWVYRLPCSPCCSRHWSPAWRQVNQFQERQTRNNPCSGHSVRGSVPVHIRGLMFPTMGRL